MEAPVLTPSSYEQKAEVKDLVKDLSSRLDFDRVVRWVEEINPESHEPESLGDIFDQLYFLRRWEIGGVLGLLDASKQHDLARVRSSLEEFRKDWEKRGFLRNKPDPNFTPEQKYGSKITGRRQPLQARLDLALLTLRDAKTLRKIFCPSPRAGSTVDFPLEQIRDGLNLEDRLRFPGEEPERIDFDPRLLRAVEDYVSQRLDQLAIKGKYTQNSRIRKEFLDQVRSANLTRLRVGGINKFVSGEMKENEANLAIRQSDILADLHFSFPAYFLQGLDLIAFTKPEDSKDLGKFVPKFAGNELANFQIRIYVDPHISGDSTDSQIARKRSVITGVIYHEIGHAMLYKLAYQDLARWEEIIRDEKVDVTWYVEDEAKEGAADDEDFCESLMLFVKNPAALSVIAPGRFNYFRDLFREYMDFGKREDFDRLLGERMQKAFEMWEKAGLTREDIKEMYYHIYEDLEHVE